MNLFCLNGYNGEKISLTLNEFGWQNVYDTLLKTFVEDGYARQHAFIAGTYTLSNPFIYFVTCT